MRDTERKNGPAVHQQSAGDVLGRLEVEPEQGLSTGEAARRLEQTGPNRLREARQRPAWRILLDQFTSPVVVLLLIAAGLAGLFGQVVEGIAIGAALVLNAGIGFVTEWRARRSMDALRRMGETTATVRRDGKLEEIAAEELVPGDIVRVTEGEIIPADLRLIAVENLQCNEAALTGESVPVAKSAEPVARADAPLAERSDMAFRGTAVTRGSADAVAVATGMEAEIGRISAMVESAQEQATPLERRLEQLAKRLIYLALIVGVLVAISGIIAGKPLFPMVETALVLAIAAVPEGLPIIATVALGRGMWRMARRNALVKELSAVETLGATTVIFTDKTGTLTENRMVMRRLALPAGDVELSRKGNRLTFRMGGERIDPLERRDVYEALRVCALCSNAAFDEEGPRGDPTEVALLEAARAAGLKRGELLESLPEEREESFSTETKKMATVHRSGDGFLVLVKGAPEAVLDACTGIMEPDGNITGLDERVRDQWLERNDALAADGLRVLALAQKCVPDPGTPPYEGLTLLGHAGLYDPPRETVGEAIRQCRAAGIRVVMVTGDQPATAANIARAVGIADEGGAEVLTGRDLEEAVEDGGRSERIHETAVFARVAPEQKLRLVQIYQDHGEVVGMTGDGVNDAPALKKADIGIAMGRRGTEVARETSDIVLKDDAFETIVMAVEQGRTIFNNLRKFVVFLLSGNLGQIIGVSAAAMANAPLPLLPLQILFLNLLLDVFPALALGVTRGAGDLMRQPPRDPREPILTRAHWWAIGGFGLLMTTALLGVFSYALLVMQVQTPTAVTMAFLSYGFARLWHAFNMRAPGSGVVRNEITGNPYIWGAIVLCGLLLLTSVYLPGLAAILDVTPLTPGQWLVVLAGSLVPLVLGQSALAIIGRRRGSRSWSDL